MDLDILLFGDLIEKTAEYTVPRPDLLKRPFMLGPMAEIAPDVRHPVANKTMAELWSEFDRGGARDDAGGHRVVPGRVPGRVTCRKRRCTWTTDLPGDAAAAVHGEDLPGDERRRRREEQRGARDVFRRAHALAEWCSR